MVGRGKHKFYLALAAVPALVFAMWLGFSGENEAAELPRDNAAQPPQDVVPTTSVPNSPQTQDAEACADLELTAAAVMPRVVEGTAPTATGGNVTDGVYDSVAFETYGELPDHEMRPFRQTLRFEDAGRRLTIARPSPRGTVDVLTLQAGSEGATMRLVGDCPEIMNGRSQLLEFSFSEQTLAVHSVRTDGIQTLTIYRKQEQGPQPSSNTSKSASSAKQTPSLKTKPSGATP